MDVDRDYLVRYPQQDIQCHLPRVPSVALWELAERKFLVVPEKKMGKEETITREMDLMAEGGC